jgi:ParB family chromosome partitioning protein
MEEELSDRLGLAVSIRTAKSGAGKLVIGFGNLDQLDEVLAKLTAA